VVALGVRSAFHQQSLYKLGWSQYKSGRAEEGLAAFDRLLALRLQDPRAPEGLRPLSGLPRADRELVDDTLRVMAITFADGDGTAMLERFVQASGTPPHAVLLHGRLGELYIEKQRFQDAAAALAAFGRAQPGHVQAPLLASRAIEALRQGGFVSQVLAAKRAFIDAYNFNAPFWAGRERAQFPAVAAELRSHVADVAQWHHAAAQGGGGDAEWQQAIRYHRLQLQQFPDDSQRDRTRLLLAEALFSSGRHAESVAEFETRAYEGAQDADAARAGYAALGAYARAETTLAEPQRAAWRQQGLESALRFATRFPSHEDAEGVLVRAVEALHASGDGARAVTAAQQLLARQPAPTRERQRIAQGVMGQVAFDQGDHAAAELAWTGALAQAEPGSAEHRDLQERLAVAVYRQAEVRRAAGDSAAAAAGFLRVAAVAPASPVAVTARYDAAAVLLAAGSWSQAIDVLEAFRNDHPQHALQPEVTQKLAVAYAADGRHAASSREYERIADRAAETAAVREEALALAAENAGKAADAARQASLLQRLLQQYPGNVAQRIEDRQQLLELALASGDAQAMRRWREALVAADAAAGPARSDRTRLLAARARLALAQPARAAFAALPLKNPLNRSLAAKRKGLDAALSALREASAYGVADVTTQADHQIAELYRRLAQDLLASERPPRLSADAREQYDLLLEEQAIPFEEQAISLHEANLGRLRDGLFNDGVQASLAALKELVPGRYVLQEQRTNPLRQLPPEDPRAAFAAQYEAALALLTAGDTAAAATALDAVLQQDPAFAPALRNAAVLALKHRQDSVAGVALLQRLHAVSPDELPVRAWLAELQAKPATSSAADAVEEPRT
jgi:outer membrane protein assembly factor BamD (BamD/ComL family)